MKPGRKKRYLFLLLIPLSVFCSLIFITGLKSAASVPQDPNFYYYSSGRKIQLPLSKEMIAVRFKQGVTLEQQKAIIESEEGLALFSERKELSVFKLALLPLREGVTEQAVIQTISSLNAKSEVEFANPVFHFPDAEQIVTDEFIVKFGQSVSQAEIEAFNTLYNVEIVEKSESIGHYTLRVKDPKNINTLKTANLYYENPITEFAVPNFIRRLKPMSVTPDDTYFPSQWALDNTGQVPPAGTPDADINAPEGWDISTGSSDIVIAIIDTGVDIIHEDLATKIWGNEDEQLGDGNGDGRPGVKDVDDDGDGLIDEDSEGREPGDPGYTNDLVDDDDENGYNDDFYGWDFVEDPVADNDPSPGNYADDAHGTACAGLAAADTNNNTKGVAGVTWNCKIMPIRVLYMTPWGWWTTDAWLAGGIKYAADNGADVLSNSWGGGSPSDAKTGAIIGAKYDGRNGKGCVIVFSSGNTLPSGGSVSYPATLVETIAVGATDDNDDRWSYSNYGNKLDVVAPSGDGETTIFWTTDITGSAGYNPGDPDEGDADGHYTKWFGGTSAAAPEVAGLAALILSIDPNLTSDEVQLIIESTADDKGDSGWDEYYGWGRINADKALCRASDARGFSVKDALGEPVAQFDNLGNLILKGFLEKHSDCTTTANDEFRFKDSYGDDVAIIDTTNGNMYIVGLLYDEGDGWVAPSGDNDFIIKDSSGDAVAYISDSGDLFLKGRLYSAGVLVAQGDPNTYTTGANCIRCDEGVLWQTGETPKYVRIRFENVEANFGVSPVPEKVDIICTQTFSCVWQELPAGVLFTGRWNLYTAGTTQVYLKRGTEQLFHFYDLVNGCRTYFNVNDNDNGEGHGGTAEVKWGSRIDQAAYENQ